MKFLIGMECPDCGHNNVFLDCHICVLSSHGVLHLPDFVNPVREQYRACEKCGKQFRPDILVAEKVETVQRPGGKTVKIPRLKEGSE